MRNRYLIALVVTFLGLAAWTLDAMPGEMYPNQGALSNMALSQNPDVEPYLRLAVSTVIFAAVVAMTLAASKLRRAIAKARHLNQLLDSIRSIIQLTARAQDRNSLIRETCLRLVRSRGYEASWIALFGENAELQATAQAGWDEEFTELSAQMKRGELPFCASQALTKPEPVVIKDSVSQCKKCPLRAKQYGRGNLIARIESGGKTYGVICVSAPPAVTIDPEEQSILVKVAADLAFSLHNAEIQERWKTTTDELRWERDVSASLGVLTDTLASGSLSVREVSHTVLDQAKRLTKSEQGFAAAIDRRTGELVAHSITRSLASNFDVRNEAGRAVFPKPEDGAFGDVWGHVLNTKEPLCTADADAHPAASHDAGEERVIRDFLAVPAMSGEMLVGELAVSGSPNGYSEREVSALTKLADIYAAAIDKAAVSESLTIREGMFASSAHAILETDVHGTVTAVNKTFVKLWGLGRPGDAEGSAASRFWNDTKTHPADVSAPGSSGEWTGELEAVKADGTTFDVSCVTSLVRDKDGRPLRIVYSFTDITERNEVAEISSVLFELANACENMTDMSTLFRTTQRELGRVMNTRNFYVALREKGSNRVSLPCFFDEMDQSQYDEVPLTRTLTRYVMDGGEPLRVTTAEYERLVSAGEVEFAGTPSKVWMGAPLRTGGEVIGLLAVQSYASEDAYDKRDEGTLAFVAEMLSQAVARSRAEDERAEGDGRFDAVAQTTSDALITLDGGINIVFWNRAAENIFGYSASEAIGKPFSLVVPEGFLQAHVEGLRQAISSQGPGYVRGKVEGVGLRKDGSEFPMELSVGAWKTVKETSFACIVRDITETKQIEEELQFLGSIPLQVSDALIVTDLNYRVTYVNKAAEYLYGYTGEELIGKTLDILSPEPWKDDFESEIHQTVSSGRVWAGTLMNKRKSGERFAVEFKISPLRDRQGRLSSYISILHDITGRKRAEQLLQTLNAAALAMEREITPDGVLSAAARELENLGIESAVFFADQVDEIIYLGHVGNSMDDGDLGDAPLYVALDSTNDLLRPMRERECVLVDDASSLLRDIDTTSSGRSAARYMKMITGRRAILAPLVIGDGVEGVFSVYADDLTAKDTTATAAFANQLAAAWRKAKLMQELEESLRQLERTQDVLLQAQKMEAIGNLAGGVAHDFNNLLTAITGYSELLLDKLEVGSTEHNDVTQIKKAGDQAAALTGQLLAFSRKQSLQATVLDLNEVVTSVQKMLGRLIGEDVSLTNELAPDLARTKVDPTQIQQVIMNLAINARDAMDGGGTLTIRTENIEIGARDSRELGDALPGPYVRLSIEDTGEGIPEDALDRIFEPFFSTKEVGKGTGLGLSVVYGIVSQHGGWINVESELGVGTAFHVFLPATSDEIAERAEARTPLPELNGAGERVLLVEDEDSVRCFAVRALKEGGYDVLEAKSAEQALEIFDQHQGNVDVVFSDVVLPRKSGVQLADMLIQRSPGIHVLLSSGYTDQKSHWPAIQERGLEFLQKPYAARDLLRTIRNIVRPA